VQNDTRWRSEVRPEWSGHTWRSLEASASPVLVAEARIWADAPVGVLYLYSGSISKAYGFAVAVSQRAEETLCSQGGPRDGLLAVGLLDELSMPDDPDPEHTERARQEYPRYSAADTRAGYAYRYAERLAEAGLALLRLPPSGDPDRVLDQVADGRRGGNRPTLVASVVPPAQVTRAYGRRIGWRLGFAGVGWQPNGQSTDGAAVLDVDRLPD
jgi:hypothetical protein